MTSCYNFLALCALALCIFLDQSSAAKSPGCGKALASNMKKGNGASYSNRVSFTTTKGAQRSFLLHFPSAYDASTAHGLIFSFHGRSETGVKQEALSKLSDTTKNPHMMVVYPDGIDNQWQGDPEAKTDDVSFTLDMISSLGKQYCIDTDMIYATGMSNGGGFSANILACDPVASTKIAAFAGVSGAYYQGTTDKNCNGATVPITCNPGRRPVPVLEFHGSADATIPYNGGARRSRCLPNIPHFITGWATRNGLAASNVSTSLNGGHVKKYEFGKAAGLQGLNTHYWIDGMGHTWPSANANYINGTPIVMDFFNKWTLKNTPITGRSAVNVAAPAQSSVTSSSSKPAASGSSSGNICPAQNGKTYASGGKTFQISCSSDSPNGPYGPVTYPGSFAACIAKCAADSKCGHVSYTTACYTKSGKPSKIVGKGDNVMVAAKA